MIFAKQRRCFVALIFGITYHAVREGGSFEIFMFDCWGGKGRREVKMQINASILKSEKFLFSLEISINDQQNRQNLRYTLFP